MKTESQINVSLPEIIGGGYGEFWRCKKRFRVVKGSRGSKKSATTSLNKIYRMMKYPLANLLVIRQVANDLKQSCYAQLLWAINRLGVGHLWKSRVSPLELEYIPTGQKIIFRGLDKWSSITSMTTDNGYLCWCWIEEAYEIDEESFDAINESFRGQLPPGYFHQLTLTFNPWSSSSWLKAKFFDNPDDRTFAITTTYKCNEWLSDEDRENYESVKYTNPDRYKVIALGEWGIEGGQYFSEWRESLHVVKPFKIPREWIKFRAADWGSSAPYCCLWIAVDYDNNLWVYRELYGWSGKPNKGTGETATQFAEKIAELETREENISYGVLDNACWAKISGPTIAEEINNILIKHRLVSFGQSSKGRAEGANQIKQRLIGNKNTKGEFTPALKVFANCLHLIRTLPMLSYDQRDPEKYDTKGEDHAVDALAYGALSRPWTPTRPKPQSQRDAWAEKPVKRSAWTY